MISDRLYPTINKQLLRFRDEIHVLSTWADSASVEDLIIVIEERCTPDEADIAFRYLLGQALTDIGDQTKRPIEEVFEMVRKVAEIVAIGRIDDSGVASLKRMDARSNSR